MAKEKYPFGDRKKHPQSDGQGSLINSETTAELVVRYLNLYRVLLALFLALLFLFPPMRDWFDHFDVNWVQASTLVYLYGSLALVIWHRKWQHYRICTQLHTGLLLDLFCTTGLLLGSGDLHGGLALLLILPLAGAGMAMRPQMALFHAALATLMVLAITLYVMNLGNAAFTALLPAGLHGMAYFGTVGLAMRLGSKLAESQALVSRRSAELKTQQQINALILQRMRNGTLVVDDQGRVQQMNEAAWYLLGMPRPQPERLEQLPTGVQKRLRDWRENGRHNPVPLRLAGGLPRIVPRFVPLQRHRQGAVLIFLEDDTTLNRRAEEISLRIMHTMARGIAHEIRNPLSAIHHAAQLLEESPLPEEDRNLLEIIASQSRRINGIIEQVLRLTQREPARIRSLDPVAWVREWVSGKNKESIHLHTAQPLPPVQFDPAHLHTILDELLANAEQYAPGSDIDISLELTSDGAPRLKFCDHGPGIPADQDQNIFAPFHTTATGEGRYGLGLYLARLLAEANLARLELLASDQGACFGLTMLLSKTAYNEKTATKERNPATV